MKFIKSLLTARNQPVGAQNRKPATVDSIRKKLADYQKTEGPACFVNANESMYLADGAIEYEKPVLSGDSTGCFAPSFS